MNDFTKEELQNILGMAKSIPIDDRILILKLESMIDNYCEHKNKNSLCQVRIFYQCNDCGEYVHE